MNQFKCPERSRPQPSACLTVAAFAVSRRRDGGGRARAQLTSVVFALRHSSRWKEPRRRPRQQRQISWLLLVLPDPSLRPPNLAWPECLLPPFPVGIGTICSSARRDLDRVEVLVQAFDQASIHPRQSASRTGSGAYSLRDYRPLRYDSLPPAVAEMEHIGKPQDNRRLLSFVAACGPRPPGGNSDLARVREPSRHRPSSHRSSARLTRRFPRAPVPSSECDPMNRSPSSRARAGVR